MIKLTWFIHVLVVQARADHIQKDLKEVINILNERSKQYGLRAKPTTLMELPFGTLIYLFQYFIMMLLFKFLKDSFIESVFSVHILMLRLSIANTNIQFHIMGFILLIDLSELPLFAELEFNVMNLLN